MKVSSQKTPVLGALIVLVALASASAVGCKKDEEPPPLPTAKKVEEPEVKELKIPDAGSVEEEEEEKKTGKGGGSRSGGVLGACCAALRQNAANAPQPTKGHMLTAAAACDSANKSGVGKAGFLSTLNNLLAGAGAPPACK